ncbi:hypothetical protein FA95DRAFT_72505 [Auriscalpium vulgare]|uniref:Uncharacterized protein n=1 Tax=Auriscalpium vulgare TaxID=40419 RepID=A0ACB8RR56_9AGAM|nr:hypothetical protein FA95DRAFT_72505 [Auriscalpium vulgare]
MLALRCRSDEHPCTLDMHLPLLRGLPASCLGATRTVKELAGPDLPAAVQHMNAIPALYNTYAARLSLEYDRASLDAMPKTSFWATLLSVWMHLTS